MSYAPSPLPYVQTLIHHQPYAHAERAPAPYLRMQQTNEGPALSIHSSMGIYTHAYRGGGLAMQAANRAVTVHGGGLGKRLIQADLSAYGVKPDELVIARLQQLTDDLNVPSWEIRQDDRSLCWSGAVDKRRLLVEDDANRRYKISSTGFVAAGLRLAVESALYHAYQPQPPLPEDLI